MEVIVSHDMADFDSLAAGVAAQRLHPKASIVLGRRMGPEVRAYLALHKDRFRTLFYTDVDPKRVDHLIVVDVRRKSRLAEFAEIIERAEAGQVFVTVYDHHPHSDDDLLASYELVQPVGSATTLLVERIFERGLPIDDVEATLFALGIHADTGSLTYAGTTGRDAHVVGGLLERGARQDVIARYLRPAFSAEQKKLLASLLGRVEVERIGHLEVAWVQHQLPTAVDGMGEVVSELAALGGHSALFAVVGVGPRRVQVIARSRSPLVDVGAIIGELGGGGHAAAASALKKRGDPAEILAELKATVARSPPRVRRVADVMSSPVHAVAPTLPLRRLARSLASWRHTGVPVVKDGALVGIVSHRDIERAERDGRLELPVSSCMTQNVRTIDADVAPELALDVMQSVDVGRLPVVRAGRVVGIVTRSDLIAMLYGHGRA